MTRVSKRDITMFHNSIKSSGSNPQPGIGDQIPGEYFTNGPNLVPRFPTVTAAILHYIRVIPNEVAAIDHADAGHRQITYSELGRRSRRLAKSLQAAGVGPGDMVPLVVKRGIDMVVGIAAILRCGAQYVPLDGGVAPKGTLQRVIEQSAGKVVLCLRSTTHRVDNLDLGDSRVIIIDQVTPGNSDMEDNDQAELLSGESPTSDSGCYIIYTSGMSFEMPAIQHSMEYTRLI